MPDYQAVLSNKARKQLDKLSNNIAEPIIKTILDLQENPRPAGYRKLKGREGFRVRTGLYRIIYDILDDKLMIDVIAIGHRKDVYN